MGTDRSVEWTIRVARVFATNTVIAERDGKAVIVDAGAGVAHKVIQTVADKGLEPVALLITHGHVDHTWDAATIQDSLDIPVVISTHDRYYLDDPFGLNPSRPERRDPNDMLVHAFGAAGLRAESFRTPRDIVEWGSTASIAVEKDLDSIWQKRWRKIASPGHTPGSTVYEFGLDAPSPLVCTGDVIFKSSIGRTDLPGGNSAVMKNTLFMLSRSIPAAATIVAGHGPTTTMELESRTNPYLPKPNQP
ncbi:MBL fold metallo-hydrolase [Rarobacter incanus]|uniref:Glyoxylase-like metal-dependent hydrolase (Beta-lactamase superfamily II) n=1 Tax=Rarobacter incanus TaxID=153494 RepID=A0A542SMP2_9MICO|nr:MBL fold metallo-hydrolase [Rarobacter incanus]TQK75896.1 glyoxylase-like metal-dependent hydrolase (beta-lactamase superfamily II) [Rarobacter incanus]